jgi:hypothetical protein
MSYIPVFCATCCRSTLADKRFALTALACAVCEELALPVVGPAYSEYDLLAFAEIERSVARAALDWSEADFLSGLLREWLDEGLPSTTIIHQALARLPALSEARGALFEHPTRGVGMLVTIFGALAGTANRKSGSYQSPLVGLLLDVSTR